MSGNLFRRSLTAVAIAAMLGVAGAGEAAIYAGRFDPVEFSGDFNIFVPDDCRATDGWHANDANCAVTLISASALVASSGPEGPDYNGTLTFAPPAISDSGTLYGVYIVNNELDSFDTGLIPFFSADPSTAANWWVEFFSGQMPTDCEDCYTHGAESQLYRSSFASVAGGVNLYASGFEGPVDNALYTSITRVPEPGTLPLLGGALLAALILRRRTAKAQPQPS